jgi:subfamily B ATP-binding cassette protein MsbA
VKNSVDDLKVKVTVIMVAHGRSTIINVDCLCFFGTGRVVEEEVYKDLSAREGSKPTQKIAKQSL